MQYLEITQHTQINHITVFGFDIAYYGMIIGAGILAGIFMAVYEAKRTGQKEEDYYDLSICAVIISIVGARAYYVIFSWDMYKDDLLSIFNLRQGGLAIYGGVIAGVITTLIFAKIRKQSFLCLVDTACAGLLVGQIIGRWGNFFNREAFGSYTDGLFAMQIPKDAVAPANITHAINQHLVTIGGTQYIQVHPTFLYESVWNILVLVIIFVATPHKKYNGQLFLLYLAGYGLGRFWIEGLRTDQLMLFESGIAVSQLLSGVLFLFAVGMLIFKAKQTQAKQTQ